MVSDHQDSDPSLLHLWREACVQVQDGAGDVGGYEEEEEMNTPETPTPRTDALVKAWMDIDMVDIEAGIETPKSYQDFARALERENAQLRRELEEVQREVHQHQLCDEKILKWKAMAQELACRIEECNSAPISECGCQTCDTMRRFNSMNK